MSRILTILGLLYSGLSFSQIQQQPTIIEADPLNLPQRSVSSSYIVLDENDIQRRGATDLSQLLEGLSGVHFTQAGLHGNSSLFVRGTNSNSVLIVMDGIPLNDPTDISDRIDISYIPVEHLAKIEFFKGSLSSLYGSKALGGVLVLTTKSADNSYGIGVGSFGTGKLKIAFGRSLAKSSKLEFFGDLFHSDSLSSKGGRAPELEKDEVDRANYIFRYWSQSNRRDLQALAINSYYFSGIDSSDPNDSLLNVKNHRNSLSLRWEEKFKYYQLESIYSLTQVNRSSVFSSSFAELFYEGKYHQLSTYIHNLNPSSVLWSAGLGGDISEQKEDSFSENSTRTKFLAGQLYHVEGNRPWSLGLRLDELEEYGQQVTYRAQIATKLGPHRKVSFSLANAFKAPSLFQLYSSGSGNINLNPEEAVSVDLSYELRKPFINVNANVYRSWLEESIDFVSSRYENSGTALITGFEFRINHERPRFPFEMNLNYLDTKSSKTEKELVGRPDWTFNFDYKKNHIKNINSTIRFFYEGKRLDVSGDYLDPYLRLDAIFEKQLNQHSKVHLLITNILGTSYEKVEGFTTAGRSFFLTYGSKF
ncbi:MAG: TonB-dependent receptor plug domain-containing protein [Bdellovibrionales bacterium]